MEELLDLNRYDIDCTADSISLVQPTMTSQNQRCGDAPWSDVSSVEARRTCAQRLLAQAMQENPRMYRRRNLDVQSWLRMGNLHCHALLSCNVRLHTRRDFFTYPRDP